MWFARQADGLRAWFVVKQSNGSLRTGIAPGSFIATVVNPSDTASTVPAVVESATKPGLYTFLIPSAFLNTHGAGSYGVVVQVTENTPPKVTDVISHVFVASVHGFDSLPAAAATAILAALVDGTITVAVALKRLNSLARGRIVLDTNNDDAAYYAEDDTTILFTNRKLSDTEREPQ